MTEEHIKMLDYVERLFEENYEGPINRPYFKHKLHHTKRVVGWVRRIGCNEGADMDIALTMAIFHDAGYAFTDKGHPEKGAEIAKDYLSAHGYSQEYISEVCEAILNHNDRSLLAAGTPINTLVMMEADNIDEKGAMALLWDAMAEGATEHPTYRKTLLRIKHHYERREKNVMVTATARKYWEEKQEAVRAFIETLELDMDM